MNDSIRVLLALSDRALSAEFVKQLKASTDSEVVQFEFDMSSDGKRALADFRSNQPHIVLASSDLAGIDGIKLAREIARESGETAVFVVGIAPSDPSYELIALPIVNWKQALARVQSGLPEHLKRRLGLEDRDVVLIQALTEYAKKYALPNAESAAARSQAMVLIPSFVAPQQSDYASVSRDASVTASHQALGSQQSDFEAAEHHEVNRMGLHHSRSGWNDVIVTAVLVIAAIALRIWPDSDRVVSARNVTFVLAVTSLLGLTLGRALERLSLHLTQSQVRTRASATSALNKNS